MGEGASRRSKGNRSPGNVCNAWLTSVVIQNRLALSALSANNATAILTQRSANIADSQNFNIKIPLEGSPITNQRSSGRCWLFASTNVFRVAFMRKYNLKEFELSQSYLFFWDKLEKANYFLEQILDTADEDLDSRLVQALVASPVGDGGQWDMVANLVQKYGLVYTTTEPLEPLAYLFSRFLTLYTLIRIMQLAHLSWIVLLRPS